MLYSHRRDLILFLTGITVMLVFQGLLLVSIGLVLLRPVEGGNDFDPANNTYVRIEEVV